MLSRIIVFVFLQGAFIAFAQANDGPPQEVERARVAEMSASFATDFEPGVSYAVNDASADEVSYVCACVVRPPHGNMTCTSQLTDVNSGPCKCGDADGAYENCGAVR